MLNNQFVRACQKMKLYLKFNSFFGKKISIFIHLVPSGISNAQWQNRPTYSFYTQTELMYRPQAEPFPQNLKVGKRKMLTPDQNFHNSIPLLPRLNFSFNLITEGTPRGLLYTFLRVAGLYITQLNREVSFKPVKALNYPQPRLGDAVSSDHWLACHNIKKCNR